MLRNIFVSFFLLLTNVMSTAVYAGQCESNAVEVPNDDVPIAEKAIENLQEALAYLKEGQNQMGHLRLVIGAFLLGEINGESHFIDTPAKKQFVEWFNANAEIKEILVEIKKRIDPHFFEEFPTDKIKQILIEDEYRYKRLRGQFQTAISSLQRYVESNNPNDDDFFRGETITKKLFDQTESDHSSTPQMVILTQKMQASLNLNQNSSNDSKNEHKGLSNRTPQELFTHLWYLIPVEKRVQLMAAFPNI